MRNKAVSSSIAAVCLVILLSVTSKCSIYGYEIDRNDNDSEYYNVNKLKLDRQITISDTQTSQNTLNAKDIIKSESNKVPKDSNLNYIKVPKELKRIFSNTKTNFNQRGIRKFPYPYRAMLAITSDTDNNTPEKFEEYHRFLNTKEKTKHGTGLGLDIGDSMWMYMGNDSLEKVDDMNNTMNHVMTFFVGIGKKKHDAKLIIKYFKAGWIDSIHTFGDFSREKSTKVTFNRKLAIEAWDAMKKVGINPTVWINHGNRYNVQNFGGTAYGMTFSYQKGDSKKSPYYHTDISIKNGIKFVWNSVGESKFGVDNPIFEIKLRDGQKVWGFHRYTNDINYENGNKKEAKVSWTWNAGALQKQITPKRLEEIIAKNQYSLVGQHLGGTNTSFPFWYEGIKNLKLLASYQDEGKILVARTSRLLNYSLAQQYLKYKVVNYKGQMWINIVSINDPVFGPKIPTINDIRGINFYLDTPNIDSNNEVTKSTSKIIDMNYFNMDNVHILLNFKPIPQSEIQVNAYDNIKGFTKRQSVGIKWFKPDYTDYTKNN